MRVALNRAARQREDLDEQLKRANSALLEAQIALQTDMNAQREKELRERIATLDNELRDLHQREARVTELLAHEVNDARRLRAMLLADDQPVPTAIDDFVEQPRANLQSLSATVETLGQNYAHQEALLNEQARVLRAEAAQLDREIQQLRSGDREASYESAAPQAMKLQRLLRAALNLAGR